MMSPGSTMESAARLRDVPSALRTISTPLSWITLPTGAAAARSGSSNSSRASNLDGAGRQFFAIAVALLVLPASAATPAAFFLLVLRLELGSAAALRHIHA